MHVFPGEEDYSESWQEVVEISETSDGVQCHMFKNSLYFIVV